MYKRQLPQQSAGSNGREWQPDRAPRPTERTVCPRRATPDRGLQLDRLNADLLEQGPLHGAAFGEQARPMTEGTQSLSQGEGRPKVATRPATYETEMPRSDDQSSSILGTVNTLPARSRRGSLMPLAFISSEAYFCVP